MSERFQPPAHVSPVGIKGKIAFYARLWVDFQVRTVFGHMKVFVPSLSGKIMDVGCGDCPYAHLVNRDVANYIPVDTFDAGQFGYEREDITRFDGKTLPFENESIDHVFCSEVFEHIAEPGRLASEICRVMKPGGTALITVPWSARFHYVPHDYYRFTPTALAALFSAFSNITITPRGTDITTIAAKIIVVFSRSIICGRKIQWAGLLLSILCSPVLLISIILGHLSLFCGIGSSDDPLGYTIRLVK
jgi:SAM-dependent methyltransferase